MITQQQLFDILIAEQQREKKITIRNIAIVAILIIAVITTIYTMGWGVKMLSAIGANSPNVRYILFAAAVGSLIYPAMVLRRSVKVKRQLDNLMNDLQAGKSAGTLTQQTIYKTTIPLGRLNLKFNPFDYLSFNIDRKNYFIPVPVAHIPDVKTLLSGVNAAQVADVWNQLYADENTGGNNAPSGVLKPLSEYQQFAAKDLLQDATASDRSRKNSKTLMYVAMLIVFGLMGGFVYYFYNRSANDAAVLDSGATDAVEQYTQAQGNTNMYIMIGFGIICALCYGYYFFIKNRAKNQEPAADFMGFKVRALQKIIAFINPGFVYAQHSHIGLAEVVDTNMFTAKNYSISGNDLISGRHSGNPFQYCDLTLSYRPNFSNEKEGDDIVFYGQYFVTKFNKRFTAPLFIHSKKSVKGIFTNNQIHSYINTSAQKVRLEDPEFDQLFDVYCDDQVMARYILTPALMQRIKALAERTKKGKYFMAFHNNKVSVLNNSGTDAFETGFHTKIDAALLDKFYLDICDQLSIIDELKLNINIWNNHS